MPAASRGRRRRGSTRSRNGDDSSGRRNLEAQLPVTLEEAYRGTQKTVTVDGRTLTVTVPPGVKTGSKLRVKGETGADLYLAVEVQPHAMFRREGNDLVTEVSVSLPQALLGAELSVPTLEGSVVMKIPAGTQVGSTFRLRGKGMPELRGRGAGDELVKVNVEIPRNLNPVRRSWWKSWLGPCSETVTIEYEAIRFTLVLSFHARDPFVPGA